MKPVPSNLTTQAGPRAFEDRLHVGRPNVGDKRRFGARVRDILDRRWFTNAGRYVQEFEGRVAAMVGVKHCVAMCNATVALEIAIRALDLRGEVIVPSFTFIATPNALQWQEITPVFCDIDPKTHNLDPKMVEKMITPRTTAIIGVHVWGRPCDIEALAAIARRRALRLLFDSAHAFGCSHRGKMIGGFGDAEVFSFHATKYINTLEGGAIVTNDEAIARRARQMKNFGFADYDRTDCLGVNGKMNEISAAMGLTNLEAIESFRAHNRRNYKRYLREFKGVPGVTVVEYDENEECNYQYIVLEIDEGVSGTDRDTLVRILHAKNVMARRYFHPGCHRMAPYASCFPHAGMMLPETEKLARRVLVLPTGKAIGGKEIEGIAAIVKSAIKNEARGEASALKSGTRRGRRGLGPGGI